MPEERLYLFDGYNLLHEAAMDDPRELVDRLASFVAVHGVRGVLVFDGVGEERSIGRLEVRYADHADDLLERLAAKHRHETDVVVVTSDRAVLGTAGQESRRVPSKSFLRELADEPPEQDQPPSARTRIEDSLDDETRERLERWRRQTR